MSIENFTGKAEAYAKGRPGYPKKVIDTIVGLAPKGAVFADIGAGTGKLTVKLAEREYSVFAVEPNRIILPSSYIKRFFVDVPEYNGHVTTV